MAIKYLSGLDVYGSIDLKKNELRNAALHTLSTAPSNPVEGQMYWDSTSAKKFYIWDGTVWQDISGDIRSISSGALNTMSITNGSGGNAVIELNHLGIEDLTAPEKNSIGYDGIMFYDTSGGGAAWLSVADASGININNQTLELASIPNSSLANSSLTVSAGNGLTTGGSVSLGGSVTLNVGAGTGISVAADAVGLKNGDNLTSGALPIWNATLGQFEDSVVTADGSAINIGTDAATYDLVVSGDLTVKGTTTTKDSEQVNIGDNIIMLNAEETGAATEDAGIEIERGTDTNVSFLWNETSDYWSMGGKLRIETVETRSSVTTSTQILTQSSTAGQVVERVSVAAIGNALGTGGHKILLHAANRDNVSLTGNTYTVTHSLGSKYVQVQILDATTFETVYAEVVRATNDTVTVTFGFTPTDGDYICMTALVGGILDESNGIAT